MSAALGGQGTRQNRGLALGVEVVRSCWAGQGEHVALHPSHLQRGSLSPDFFSGCDQEVAGALILSFTKTLSLPEFCPHVQTPATPSDRKASANWLGPQGDAQASCPSQLCLLLSGLASGPSLREAHLAPVASPAESLPFLLRFQQES